MFSTMALNIFIPVFISPEGVTMKPRYLSCLVVSILSSPKYTFLLMVPTFIENQHPSCLALIVIRGRPSAHIKHASRLFSVSCTDSCSMTFCKSKRKMVNNNLLKIQLFDTLISYQIFCDGMSNIYTCYVIYCNTSEVIPFTICYHFVVFERGHVQGCCQTL